MPTSRNVAVGRSLLYEPPVVSITLAGSSSGVTWSGGNGTYSTISIGAPSADRIVVACFFSESTVTDVPNFTIDYGAGAVQMIQAPNTLAVFGSMISVLFYLPVPTGTTATFVGAADASPGSTANHFLTYAVRGAHSTPNNSNLDTSTDMDATDPLTTGSTTIPTNGGMLAIAACAADTVGKTWTGLTEDVDVDAGTFRATSASSTTPGTATRTCTGGTNGENGALSWIIFNPAQHTS